MTSLSGPAGRRDMSALYGSAIFLSAALVFLVQLVIGKALLPWFGGAAGVWTACLLFFQTLLLGGYAYAHALDRLLPPRRQARVHLALLALAAAALFLQAAGWDAPLLPGAGWRPRSGDAPLSHLAVLLTVGVGLPYLLLAAGSPLLQRWFSLTHPGRSPYRLYALSNAGSLIGLLAYPFLIEPFSSLAVQAWAWALAFLLYGFHVILLARRLPDSAPAPLAEAAAGNGPARLPLVAALSGGVCALFLSVTNLLCQEVASVPFLWVLPLALYLATFILAFERPAWSRRPWLVPAAALATLAGLAAAHQGAGLGLLRQIVLQSAALFLLGWCAHAEVARLRPPPDRITAYYLALAAGGAAGGLMVAVVAPLCFRGYWEFQIAVAGLWLLLAAGWSRDRSSPLHRGDVLHAAGAAALAAFVLLRIGLHRLDAAWVRALAPHRMAWSAAAALAVGIAALLLLRGRPAGRSPRWPRALVAATLLLAGLFLIHRVLHTPPHTVARTRNFYGVLTVTRYPGRPPDVPPALKLTHGAILHGLQVQDPVLRRQPVAYYAPGSGLEIALRTHPRRTRGEPVRLGVIGLGTGNVAAFGRAGDLVRFYELDPAVVAIAHGPRAPFTYLADAPAAVEVVEGDARLRLEEELARGEPGGFDALVLDAFSSDAIPVHLLTREAVEVYLRHLRDDESLIAVNISNRFLDLRPPVLALARDLGLHAAVVRHRRPPDRPSDCPSVWVVLSRAPPAAELQPHRADPAAAARAWTDRSSNLFQLLK